MFWTGLALGFVLGCIYYKYATGIADVEAEAFVNGYADGYSDSERKRPQKYEIWDAASWREEAP
jgi:hypothetical protein